jgi:hypothetical protein
MPATADDIGGTGSALQVLTRVKASPNVDTVEWRAVASLLTPDLIAGIYATNWAVTNWYLDQTIGSDSNDGLTALSPLKTPVELTCRLGPRALWDHSVTVHVGINGLGDLLCVRGDLSGQNNFVDVIGTPTVLLDAGTIATFAAVDHTVPRSTQLTATGVADWTPYIGKRIRITSGARSGTIMWIMLANPDGSGVATARVQPPARIDTAGITQPFATTTPIVGDPIVIESVPYVPTVVYDVQATQTLSTGTRYAERLGYVLDLSIRNLQFIVPSNIGPSLAYQSMVFGCNLSVVDAHSSAIGIFNFPIVACLSTLVPGGRTSLRSVGAYVQCGFLGDGTFACYAGINYFTNCCFQGMSLTSNLAGTNVEMSGIQLWGASFLNGTLLTSNNLSGSVTDIGVVMLPNTRLRLRGTWNLLAVTAQVQLQSPTLNLTKAQALACGGNDFEQKGVATIGATAPGYVDVVVPYWDPAVQTLVVSRRNELGTIGNLSAPIANRNGTGFRILSSNVLDVSTVDWQISSAGRGLSLVTV